MQKIVITFGIIAGVIVSSFLAILFSGEKVDFENGELIGYSSMIIGLSTIFFAVKTYRDKHQAGVISFGKAFQIGLYISLIASTLYVLTWMVITNTSGKDYMTEYYNYTEEKLRESDTSEAEIQVKLDEIKELQEIYKNPLVAIGVTYLEILPIGLLVSLISALILQRKVSEENPATS